jgi:hypothetical protein
MKLDLLTNATVVEDAIRFVSNRSNGKLNSFYSGSSEGDKEESNKPDYNEGEGQLEVKQDEKTAEITAAIITNQVF